MQAGMCWKLPGCWAKSISRPNTMQLRIMAEAMACTAMHGYAQLCTAHSWHAVLICSIFPSDLLWLSQTQMSKTVTEMHFTCLVVPSKAVSQMFPRWEKDFPKFPISFLKLSQWSTNIAQTVQLSGVGNVEGGLFNEVSWPQTWNLRGLFWQTLLRLLSNLCVVTFGYVTFLNLVFEIFWVSMSFQHDFTDRSWRSLIWSISLGPELCCVESPFVPTPSCSKVFDILTYWPQWVNFCMCLITFCPGLSPLQVFFSHRISQANSDHCPCASLLQHSLEVSFINFLVQTRPEYGWRWIGAPLQLFHRKGSKRYENVKLQFVSMLSHRPKYTCADQVTACPLLARKVCNWM